MSCFKPCIDRVSILVTSNLDALRDDRMVERESSTLELSDTDTETLISVLNRVSILSHFKLGCVTI